MTLFGRRPGSVRSQPRYLRFGLAAYLFFVVVINRSSLGVAGRFAETRFGIGPGELSLLVMLQLGIYAALQVPAGALVDRFGPRRTLTAAGLLTGTAQVLFGLTHHYPLGVAARIVLGCGDALTFVSVLRVAVISVDRQRYPTLVALTQLIGLGGSLVATLPLLVALRTAGWEATFCGLAIATATAAVAVHIGLRDALTSAPEESTRPPRMGLGRAAMAAWRRPEARLGYWLHVSCVAMPTTFLLLWGYPYLTRGAGMGEAAAGSVLFAGVLLSGALPLVAGWWYTKRPAARVPTAMGVAGAMTAMWGLVLALGGRAPIPLLVAPALVVTMVGLPACAAAFAIVRDSIDAAVVSTATGIVNVGGYLAAVVDLVVAGLLLQLLGGENPAAFRVALAAMVLVQVVALIRAGVWSRRTRLRERESRRSAGLAR